MTVDDTNKDASRAEVGPLADSRQRASDVLDELPLGDPDGGFKEDAYDDEPPAGESEGMAKEAESDLEHEGDPEGVAETGVDDDFDRDEALAQMEQQIEGQEGRGSNEPIDKEARRISEPQEATPPDDFRPLRPTPDLGKRKDKKDTTPTDLDTHGAEEGIEDMEDKVEKRIRVLQGESDESHQEVVEQQAAKSRQERAEFDSEPTEVSVERSDYGYSGHSTYPIDSYSESMPKSGSADLMAILERDNVNPVTLMQAADQIWGDDWLEWEPETIMDEVKDKGGFELPPKNQDKIMALKVLANRDSFWTNYRVFENVVLAFNHRMVDWGQIQEPRAHDIAAATELIKSYIRDQPYSEEVKSYVASAALRDGYVMLPPSLTFAQNQFTNKLIETMGDEALSRQQRLNQALESEDISELTDEDMIQYLRLVRCEKHKEVVLNEVK